MNKYDKPGFETFSLSEFILTQLQIERLLGRQVSYPLRLPPGSLTSPPAALRIKGSDCDGDLVSDLSLSPFSSVIQGKVP